MLYPFAEITSLKELKKTTLIEFFVKQNLVLKAQLGSNCQLVCQELPKVFELIEFSTKNPENNQNELLKELGKLIRRMKQSWPVSFILADAVKPERRFEIKKILELVQKNNLETFYKEKSILRVI